MVMVAAHVIKMTVKTMLEILVWIFILVIGFKAIATRGGYYNG